MIRVRFAPSPTGNLHIGGARTALFNWLYARAKSGEFILRIEDTDKLRSRQEYVDEILGSLKWLGFEWNEVYYQSQRLKRYQECAEKLLAQGKAYKEKSPEKGEAVIFKVMPQNIRINDLIRGEIVFDSKAIKDQVLIKSDGTATYNFACVVDDADMNISHVIRGDDHISNTPKQVLLYEALGLPLPVFAHLPLILGAEGGRLSKRTGATAISDYRRMGYLPQALVNYLLLLSWAPGEDREVMDIQEAIKLFDIKDVNKTAAAFDMHKLNWINSQYIKEEDPQKITDIVIPLLIERKYIDKDNFDRNYVFSLVKLFQGRLNTLAEFAEWADFFFTEDPVMDPEAEEKFLAKDLSREFSLFSERLASLHVFEVSTIEESFRQLVKELGIETRALIHPLRVALTGKTIGPGLFEVVYYLGRERTEKRLRRWIKGRS
ncbi:MAG: glutamate--tRNA ligase [Candidatus Omnitrophota bacterium]